MEPRIQDDPARAEVLRKMCSYVNAPFEEIDFSNNQQPYYLQYKWTMEQEHEFKQWLLDLWTTDKKKQLAFFESPGTRRDIVKRKVDMFVFNFGWSISDSDTTEYKSL